MPNILKKLFINRVDLVKEGADSVADVKLCKGKETDMTFDEVISKLKPEHAAIIKGAFDEATQAIAKANAATKAAEEKVNTSVQEPTQTEEDVIKAMPKEAREMFEQIKKERQEAIDKVAEQEAIAKAKEFSDMAAQLEHIPLPEDKLVALAKSCDKETFEALVAINKANTEGAFGEVGKSGEGDAGADAWAKIEKSAEAIAAAEGISTAKAISKAITQNPDLYDEYVQGGTN